MSPKEKARFIVVFFASYFLLLGVTIYALGDWLASSEGNLIIALLGKTVNYSAFEFVSYCSGLVSVSAYLGVCMALISIKQKVLARRVAIGVGILFLANILRLIAVLLSEKIGIVQVVHVLSWFFMFVVIVWLAEMSVD